MVKCDPTLAARSHDVCTCQVFDVRFKGLPSVPTYTQKKCVQVAPPSPPAKTILCVQCIYLNKIVLFSVILWSESGYTPTHTHRNSLKKSDMARERGIARWDPAHVASGVMMCVHDKFQISRSKCLS